MREKGRLPWDLGLRRDGSEGGVGIEHSTGGVQPLRKHQGPAGEKPWDVAVGPDRRWEDAESKIHPLREFVLGLQLFHSFQN